MPTLSCRKYRGVNRNLVTSDFSAGLNSETIENIMQKLTMGEFSRAALYEADFVQICEGQVIFVLI